DFFRRAAEQGNAAGMCNLGLCYLHGAGVEQNEDMAREWISRAAAKGNKSAINHMRNFNW
ncbi:MAG: tetratricopeptide repeat protein, partial [Akkermansia sp.]